MWQVNGTKVTASESDDEVRKPAEGGDTGPASMAMGEHQVYRTVRTVMWEVGWPINDQPPT